MHFPSKIARDCPYMESPSVKSHGFTDEAVKMTVPSVKWQVFTDDLKKLVLIAHSVVQMWCKTQKKNRKSLKQRFAIQDVPGAGAGLLNLSSPRVNLMECCGVDKWL